MGTATGTVDRDEANVVAIDIGGSTTKLALVDRLGGIRLWRSLPTIGSDPGAFLELVAASARNILSDTEARVAGVSVAIAGFVAKEGFLTFNANLPWLERFPVAQVLAQELDLPVQADADSNAATVAEFVFGQGRGSKRFLCLTGGTGLGVGMIADGRLMRIAHGCLGDAGHVVVQAGGPLCSCGGRGCAEALLSTAYLAERYSLISNRTTFRELVEDAQQAKAPAQALLEEAGQWLGIAAASLANIFFPDCIAIAGGLSRAGSVFIDSAHQSFQMHAGALPRDHVAFVRATTGEHASLLGAAASFFHPRLL